MTALDIFLEPIRKSPLANEAAALLQQEMEEERKRRERFYADMTLSQKVEFIGGEVVMHSPVKDRHLVSTSGLTSLLNAHAMKNSPGVVRTEK